MSISRVYASVNPHQRALYPDGVNVILALLGLGGTNTVHTESTLMFGSDHRMVEFIRQINALDASPEIRSTSALFLTEDKGIIDRTYYNLVRDLVSIYKVNFQDPATVTQLNQWIQARSGFADVLSPTSLRLAYAVAVNTLWFKDTWKIKFDPTNTRPVDFHRRDGTIVPVPMMIKTSSDFRYLDADGLQGVQLEFDHGAVAEFVMGLPAESDIGAEYGLSHQFHNENRADVTVLLPKFKHEERIDLKPTLTRAGFGGLFTPGNLGRMLPADAFISEFKQIIFAEFNEEGAEVRAVTYAVGSRSASFSTRPRVEIRFDRPFHYRITKAGSTLLQGYYEGLTQGYY